MDNIVDVHCHLIPNVDDGAKSYEMALEIIQREYRAGVKEIIITPHFRKGMFEPNQEILIEKYEKLKLLVKDKIPNVKLHLGCEFHVSMDMVEQLNSNPIFCMAQTEFVLIEFNEFDDAGYIKDRLQAVKMAGYKLIVAHVERYEKLMKRFEVIEELVEMGIWIQLNADSILGKNGWKVKRQCMKLMKDDLIHLVGSDAHNLSDRAPNLGNCADYVRKKLGDDYAKKVFIDNPMKIINTREKLDGK
ncbi:CpsB/CapC family capsule biosynthesis tyrosine phosphatase [Floccifex sp.]|uniref:CpsB/CapC family capsule biosynthesis tyrosine phosphatase n=1 Tax=Floccifex sp. TaxID=2815810 RepID=UPI003F0B1416